MKNKRIERLLESGVLTYLLVFLLFCTALLFVNPWMGGIGIALLVVMFFVQRRANALRRRELLGYIEGVSRNADAAVGATSSSVTKVPLPTVIARIDTGEIIWYNKPFSEIVGEKDHIFETVLSDAVPTLSLGWLIAGRSNAPEPVRLGDRWFEVCGATDRLSDERIIGTLYFIDRTEEQVFRSESQRRSPVVGILMLDNYDELTKNLSEQQKSTLIAGLDDQLNQWLNGADFLLRKFEKDRYVMVCEKQLLDRFVAEKFPVLDAVRALDPENPPTLSLGFGVGGSGYAELFSFASLAIDMALSRGGDQAVVKDSVNFSFFGGKTSELEKRTKVKSRVMAGALRQLIGDSSQVFVMGHKNSDLDSVGAAAGIVCACRKLDRPAKIVIDRGMTAAGTLLSRLAAQPEYEDVFLSPDDALVQLDSRTLLVVVDTNRPEVVESKPLLEAAVRVAVIDHHRRAASYIEGAALNLHEPYASSCCELVCEVLSYLDAKPPILKAEADALLSGIVLDTKNFTLRTGVRTFEAAATLRLAGADPVEIKKLFQTDFDDYLERCQIITKAVPYKSRFAIVTLDHTVPRVVAAQAADELLSIQGIQASFVIFPENGQAILSARSLGQVNVQTIVEKLGGGGHLTMAGAQMQETPPETAAAALYTAIDEVCD